MEQHMVGIGHMLGKSAYMHAPVQCESTRTSKIPSFSLSTTPVPFLFSLTNGPKFNDFLQLFPEDI